MEEKRLREGVEATWIRVRRCKERVRRRKRIRGNEQEKDRRGREPAEAMVE